MNRQVKNPVLRFFDVVFGIDNVRTLIIALSIVLFVRSSIAAPYKIPSGSMIPTLKIGDHIFVSKLSYGLKIPFTNFNIATWDKPKRGDVIVFKYPLNPSIDYVKRVVGLPGDRIEVRAGRLFINGELIERQSLPKETLLEQVEQARERPERFELYMEEFKDMEHYALHHSDFFFSALSEIAPVVVKEGHYFVMGDNRDNSQDSRKWGLVSFDAIRGQAKVVFFSIRKDPSGKWWSRWSVRWNRFGTLIK